LITDVNIRYGDMRLPVMDHFKKVWNVLGPRQTLFIKVRTLQQWATNHTGQRLTLLRPCRRSLDHSSSWPWWRSHSLRKLASRSISPRSLESSGASLATMWYVW
jgi:hypothetical protein